MIDHNSEPPDNNHNKQPNSKRLLNTMSHSDGQAESSTKASSRLGNRSFRSVATPELVNVVSSIVQVTHAEAANDAKESDTVRAWTSSCGEVTIERHETAHDELRFFAQNPDDYYTEYTLSYRNYLVFAYRDLVWTNIKSQSNASADSIQEIPEACWKILSETMRTLENERQKSGDSRQGFARSSDNRRSLANLLRAG